MVHKIPTIELNWMWLKDKRLYVNKVPHSHNYHIIVLDEDDNMCGWWVLERID